MIMFRRARIEYLETRNLLSADLADGILNVLGTRRADTISVQMDDDALVVKVNGESSSFDAEDVDRIVIQAGKGNDRVTVAADVLIDTEIWGGHGSDFLIGGSGEDELYGQNGKDMLDGRGGDDCISGGNGSDTLEGGGQADELKGGNGADDINGESGEDELHGGKGRDVLHGGRSDDYLNGDEGCDLLDGDGGNDDEDADEDDLVCDLDVKLVTELSGVDGASGSAEFEFELDDKGTELEFEMELEGLDDHGGESLNVYFNGQLVGQIELDEDGRGRLKYSTDADEDEGGSSFSDAFPAIAAGTMISIQLGDGTEVLSGVFEVD